MLKKITPRHRDIMRRLIQGQLPKEICLTVGMTETRLSLVRKDPLFASEMMRMEEDLREKFLDNTSDVQELIQQTAIYAAKLSKDVVADGSVDGEIVNIKDRLHTARDMLDRAGHSGVQKNFTVVGSVDALVEAFKKRKALGASGPR